MNNRKPRLAPRVWVFMGLCLVCVTVAGGYVLFARHRLLSPKTELAGAPAVAPAPAQLPLKAPAVPPAPVRQLLYCSTVNDVNRGRLATLDLSGPNKGETHFYNQLNCVRADFRGGRGICLRMTSNALLNTNEAVIFDKEFKIRHTLPLSGAASRTRVSPDGRWGAVTVFTGGDSYSTDGFSTKTTLIDLQAGTTQFDLEELVVRNKGVVFKAVDFNFWGVTFTKDSRHFYATLGTGGKIYLVKGDAVSRQADVITEDVECPALSPDNTRIAFKKRIASGFHRPMSWRLAVIDLASLQVITLPESDAIDQQVQWYDNRHVLYSLPEYIVGQPPTLYTWIIPADGKGPRQKLLKDADSPVVLQ